MPAVLRYVSWLRRGGLLFILGPGGRKSGNTAARITTQVLYYCTRARLRLRRMQTSDANLLLTSAVEFNFGL